MESTESLPFDFDGNDPEISFVSHSANSIRSEIQKVITGQDKTLDLLLAGLFAGGNVLLEGVPGVAKTLMVKLLAQTIKTGFKRIQFTPDLMPADIIGTTIFDVKTSSFVFRPGPLFSNFILVDEVNRAPAKTQAALIEAMEEKQVTVDGNTYPLQFPLFIVATQNPIEQEGTYKLPEAQLDRFMFKIDVDYPDIFQETEILTRFADDFNAIIINDVKGVLNVDELKRCQQAVQKVQIKPELILYIAKIVFSTRDNPDIYLGASTRASLAILKAAKAMAAISNRNYVTPDDVKDVAFPVLSHRLILTPEREIEGTTVKDIINETLQKIEVPQ
jgi:MoxR-like ATPase